MNQQNVTINRIHVAPKTETKLMIS